jgi:hypothetical protein
MIVRSRETIKHSVVEYLEKCITIQTHMHMIWMYGIFFPW